MTALSNLLSKPSSEKNLRPFDVRRDSSAVADLVELCFADTLDADGRRYLHHMRTTGNTAGILRWTRLTTGLSGTPLAGYVWEQDGEIVGNASLIPYFVRGKRTYLIANVAVHPDFRRRGIARKLTRRLVKGLRAREAIQVWLHVRHDNIAAFDLYRSEGFIERTRRTTWITRRGINLEEPAVEARFSSPHSADWAKQSRWLERAYPDQYSWHLSMDTNLLRPGFLGGFWRLINNARIAQFSMRRGNRLLGVVSWQASFGASDHLLMALPQGSEEEDVRALLVHALKRVPSTRAISMDYPAGQFQGAIQAAGFDERQTLIWMVLPL